MSQRLPIAYRPQRRTISYPKAVSLQVELNIEHKVEGLPNVFDKKSPSTCEKCSTMF